MRKLMKRIISVLVLIMIVVGVVFVLSNSDLIQIRSNREAETTLVQDRLVELSEWTTLRYDYSNVIISRTDKTLSVLGNEINYAETIKLIAYSGYLKAGTDMSKVTITYDNTTKKVLASVPKSKILDNVVDTNKTTVEDIKGNIFSDYPSQIIFDEINANKKQLEIDKIDQGFLDEADNRIHQLLTTFLIANGFEDVVIEFY